ncbi:MAG: PD40 domain-containing protein, partial [Anaerolineae bacterium]|nr:PD40 domain-containing protein [Anaerolineae bacterium]
GDLRATIERDNLIDEPSDFLPHFHTPTGAFPPIKGTPADEEEAEATAPRLTTEHDQAPVDEPSDFLPYFHTSTGDFSLIEDALPFTQETEAPEIDLASRLGGLLDPLPPEPSSPPDVFQPILDDLSSTEEELEPPPPVAPISDDTSEFIPLFHTPTGILPPIPEDLPLLQRSGARNVEAEVEGEVVEVEVEEEWTGDIDQRLQRARQKMQAAADQKATSQRKKRSLQTMLVVIVITILTIVVTLAVRPFLITSGTETPPGQPTSNVTPNGTDSAISPLLLTPTATTIPVYSQGRIAFSSNRDGNFEIYTLEMRSGKLTRLTNDPKADRSPKWSPDGSQIVFISDRSGNDDLYLLSGNNKEPIRLTTDPGSDRNPAWSPDGKYIVFSRETVDGSKLVTMPTTCLSQPDTCESKIAELTPGGYDLFPAWSPDGDWVAFAASDFPGLPYVIGLIGPDGSGYQSLPGTGTSDSYPAWSPDGKRIAFVSYAQGDYDLWVMEADGQNLVQMTQSEATDVEPAWSPDGGYIVFASDRSMKGFELYLIRSDCASPQAGCEAALVQLTDDNTDDLNPDWTPLR